MSWCPFGRTVAAKSVLDRRVPCFLPLSSDHFDFEHVLEHFIDVDYDA
jgi:hypothetical protein